MSDIVTGKTFVDGEKGITAAKLNQIQSLAVIQPAFYSAKPTSSTLDPTDQLLELKGTGAYATITGQQLIDSVSASVSSVRPRSFNAIGNPSFEVDQRNVGTAVAMAPGVNGWVDRWQASLSGTMRASSQQIAANVVLPGTNFLITQSIFRVTLTTIKATLAATDYLSLTQIIEGPLLRELLGDVHSVSLLVRSSVANLKFGMALQDAAGTHSLAKLCTLGAANTWTLIQLPNLPLWMAAATWALTPGAVGYSISVNLATGSTYTIPANDTWQTSPGFGAVGQSNFAAGPVNSTFDIAFCQHEPGAPTALIDKPFTQNYDECLRYFCKSYPYATAVGAPNTASYSLFNSVLAAAGAVYFQGGIKFPKQMARNPTVIPYYHTSGAANTVYVLYATSGTVPTTAGTNAISSVAATSSGIANMVGSMSSTSPVIAYAEWTADTGW